MTVSLQTCTRGAAAAWSLGAWLLAACLLGSAADAARVARWSTLGDGGRRRTLAELHREHPTFEARVRAISHRFLGTRYQLDPLGEGAQARIDRDPIVRFDRVDCLTFVEQVLALAQRAGLDAAITLLQRYRYTDGEIRWRKRRHLMELQWLPQLTRAGALVDVTAAVGGEATRIARRTVTRRHYPGGYARFKRRMGAAVPTGDIALAYVPPTALRTRLSALPAVTLLALVRKTGRLAPLFIKHVGLVLKDGPGGALVFRHAIHIQGRVVDEPMEKYLARHAKDPKTLGFHIVELRPLAE